MPPRRIHIIGASGSGKTYLGRKLARRYDLPLQDLDEFKWDNTVNRYGVARPETERDQLLMDFIAQPEWIVEGIYYGWVEQSFARADAIIILQPRRFVRNYRMIKRFLLRKIGWYTSKNETVKDLIALIKWTDGYAQNKMPEIMAITDQFDRKRFVFKNADEALDFF